MKRRNIVIVIGVLLAMVSAYLLVDGWMSSGSIRYGLVVTLVGGIALAALEARNRT